MLHQYDDRDRVVNDYVFSEHHSSVGLSKSDQRLQHTDGFSVLCQCRAATQVAEIGLENHLSLLSANWFNVALHKNYVFGQFVNRPLHSYLIFLLVSTECKFEVCLSQIILSALLVDQNEDKIETGQQTTGYSSILIVVVPIVPLLAFRRIRDS